MPTITPTTPVDNNNGNNTPNIPTIGGGSIGAAIAGGNGAGGNGTINNSANGILKIPDVLVDNNYNKKFKNGGYAQFRDDEVTQAFSILIGNTKPNILMEGQAGVGKTKIVEDLAYRLANNDALVPSILKDYTIYELQLSSLVAGNGVVGDIEKEVQEVLKFLSDPNAKAIVFIDEIHLLFTDRSSTYEKIAQMLKPALARGDLKCIGATTIQEGAEIMRDPAFSRRFTRLIVPELSKEQTVEILKTLRPQFIQHYNDKINFSESILPELVDIAVEYQTAGSHRPDNAITLMDRSIAAAYMDTSVLRSKSARGDQEASNILSFTGGHIMININTIRKTAMRIATGNTDKIEIDVAHYRKATAPIKGQDNIMPEIEKIIRRWDLNLFPRVKPVTVMFAGSSGVGKTETATIIAKEIMGTKPIILNMTEFSSPMSITRITGSHAGYVGSDSHAEKPFDSLETNPYQVILLDEFEKGHQEVQRLFMEVFDKGAMKMANGKEIDFSKSIIIATTNAAHTDKKKNTIGFVDMSEDTPSKQETVDDLSRFFDLALLNRFEYIYTFNDISKDVYIEIMKNIYKDEMTRIKNTRRTALPEELDDETAEKLAKDSYVADFGARPARKTICSYIENTILDEIDTSRAKADEAAAQLQATTTTAVNAANAEKAV